MRYRNPQRLRICRRPGGNIQIRNCFAFARVRLGFAVRIFLWIGKVLGWPKRVSTSDKVHCVNSLSPSLIECWQRVTALVFVIRVSSQAKHTTSCGTRGRLETPPGVAFALSRTPILTLSEATAQ